MGKRIGVDIRGFTRLVISSTGETLQLSKETAPPVDAELAGGPVSLSRLAGAAPEGVLQRGDVTICGDTEVAQKFRELAMLLRPDLEEEMSLVIGDVPAYQIGRLARGVLQWTRRAAQTGVQNVAEYLGHERRDLVPRAEGDQFLKGVDRLREDTDRLEARLDWLSQRKT
jgi:ubiquinone biosynthesis accessory factor UbiJ